jgi:predicted outer membrane repeat protein
MKYLAALMAWGVFVVAVLLYLPAPAAAGGVIGFGPGTCTPAELASKIAGGGQFTFNCGGPATIVLTGTLDIAHDTTLDGGGVITISGGGQYEVFNPSSGGLALNNLTVADGSGGEGGGIFIDTEDWLTLVNTNFVGNQASFNGGAIRATGPMTITGGLFYSNTASDGGGAIYSAGIVTISGATFLSNTATLGGGAIFNDLPGQLTIQTSTLQGNTATNGRGGAIWNAFHLILNQDTLANNSAPFGGGLADDIGSSANVFNSTFTHNTAFGGGGLVMSASVTISNSTFSANSSTFGGGGALVQAGTLQLHNSTFYTNTAGGAHAIQNAGGVVTVENSIVAGSAGGNCSGVFNSLGYNIEDGTDCMFILNTDFQLTNPQLGPLADNGGPTQTHALLPISLAIKHGKITDCPVTDQRGFLRVGGCDAGAFQVVYRVLEPLVRK